MVARARYEIVDGLELDAGHCVARIQNGRWRRFFLLHVVLPTAVGATIYLLFRTTSLLVFDWLQTLHLLPLVMVARQFCSAIRLPEWLLYSLPDGLWVYAVTSWMILIWSRRPPMPWLIVGVALGVGGELGQAVGMVSGTYQHLDMIFYLLGFITACLQLEIDHETSLRFRIGAVGNDCLRLWKR
jgi:hypothetical protein